MWEGEKAQCLVQLLGNSKHCHSAYSLHPACVHSTTSFPFCPHPSEAESPQGIWTPVPFLTCKHHLCWFSGDFCLVTGSPQVAATFFSPPTPLPPISFLAHLNKIIAPGKEWNLSITNLLPRACSLHMTQPMICSCSDGPVPSAGWGG